MVTLVFELGMALRPIIGGVGVGPVRPAADLVQTLGQARLTIQNFLRLPYVPVDSLNALRLVLASIEAVIREPESELQRGALLYSVLEFQTILARDLSWFDLYWIQPKLAYSTPALLVDASSILPDPIRKVLSDKIKYEVQQAANCLLYEAYSAVGFHILRAVEITILTISPWRSGQVRNRRHGANILAT